MGGDSRHPEIPLLMFHQWMKTILRIVLVLFSKAKRGSELSDPLMVGVKGSALSLTFLYVIISVYHMVIIQCNCSFSVTADSRSQSGV